ncbi:MAG: ABC transporter permease [Acidobacteriia bacterium]|nr:ABC transporter permease [Terriglobia bacterium]
MRPSRFLRLLRRESRGSRGRLAFFAACLAVGVAAVVAVSSLSAGLERGIRTEARQLLAADLRIGGRAPVPQAVLDLLSATRGVERTDVKEMPSVVAAVGAGGEPGLSQLVELKAIGGRYPYYGTLRVEPDRPLDELLDPEGAVVDPELTARLGLKPGDELRIGGATFRVRGTVLSEPDRLNVSFTLGPRVLVSLKGLERSGLEAFGSRIERRVLLKLPDGWTPVQVDALADRLRAAVPANSRLEVETFRDARPELREGIRRAASFLGLVALLSLLVGGIGVAQTVRAWIAGRLDAIAVLKCLGMRPREILALYLGHTVLLGLAGSLCGAALGVAIGLFVPLALRGTLPSFAVSAWEPLAAVRGLGLGVSVAVVFSLPPLVGLRRVPPSRVLRRDADALAGGRWVAALVAGGVLLGIFVTAWVQSGKAALGAGFAAGIVAATGALALAAAVLARAVGRLPRIFARVWVRHGLSAVARPGAGTIGAIVALGLGVLVVLGLWLVQQGLVERLRADLPSASPTAFLIDIQPDQWPGVSRLLTEQGATRIESVPVVTARLSAVDGRPVERIAAPGTEDRRHRWVLTREQRLTYLEKLPPGNVVVEGTLWSDPANPEISIERDFARDLGVHVGSTLTFDVQGVPVRLRVTSLRTVEWKTFGINFFLIVEPGVLDGAPQTRVATARLPAGREQAIQDRLAAAFPNVMLLRIREILEKIVAILDRIGLGIRLLGGFTVAAGIAILAGAISAGSARRGREVALLKTLGMTRRGVVLVFSVEYALIGLVAGAIGGAGGGVLAWAVLTRGMDTPWSFHLAPFAVALLSTVALSVLAGIAASTGALARRPIDVLRAE